MNLARYPHKLSLWLNQCLSIHQKQPILISHIFYGKQDIAQDDIIIFDSKRFVLVSSTKIAFVSLRTAQTRY